MSNKSLKKELMTMEIVNLTMRIDKQLRTDFQIYAKKHDTTVTAILTEYIESLVNENK
jgi:hypothetical protein